MSGPKVHRELSLHARLTELELVVQGDGNQMGKLGRRLRDLEERYDALARACGVEDAEGVVLYDHDHAVEAPADAEEPRKP